METLVDLICPQCGIAHKKPLRYLNAAKKRNGTLYCSKACSGVARRSNKTESQKKEEKRIYDLKYRDKNSEILRDKKAKFFQKDYKENPEKYREQRRKRQPKHNEYCRQPAYKEKKKEYDEIYRAKKLYGDFWESAILIKAITQEYDNREVKQQNNLINKSKNRKRSWEQLQKNLQPTI